MKTINVGDIVIIWGRGVRGIITCKRDEIVPQTGLWQDSDHYKTRTVYQVAGCETQDQWFEGSEIDVLSARQSDVAP